VYKLIISFPQSKWFNPFLFTLFFAIPFVLYRNLYLTGYWLFSGDGVAAASTRLLPSMSNDVLPLWNRYLGNGAPFAADINNAALYPIGILLSLLPLPMLEHMYIYYVFHIAAGAFFFYLYLKEIGCSKLASVSTALIYLLSIHIGGLRKSHIIIIITIIYLPVILYFVERYFKTRCKKHLLCISFAMALQLYSGFIQSVVYTFIVIFFYALTLAIIQRKTMKISQFFIDAAILGGVFAGLSAALLIPMLFLQNTYLGWGSLSDTNIAFFQMLSTHPINLMSMFFPGFWGMHNVHAPLAFAGSGMDIELFLGTMILPLAIYAVIYIRSKVRIKMAAVIVLLTFVFSSHAQVPFLSELLFRIPVINGFRAPSRVLFIFIFFIYVLFAHTLSTLADENERVKFFRFAKKYAIALLVFIAVLTPSAISAIAFESVAYSEIPQTHVSAVITHIGNTFSQAATIAILFLLVTFILPLIKNKIKPEFQKWTPAVICALIVGVTVLETHPFTTQTHPTNVNSLIENENVRLIRNNIGRGSLLNASATIHSLWTHGSLIIPYNSNMLAGIPIINAYKPFNNPNLFRSFSEGSPPQLNYSEALLLFPNIQHIIANRNDLLSMLGVKFIIDPDNLIPEESETYIPFIVNGHVRIFENLNARDVLFAPTYTQSIHNREDIFFHPEGFHLSNGSYIENFRNMDLSEVETTIQVRSFTNNGITATVASSAPSFINFSQNYFPGWRAYVNNQRVPLHMVNSLIMGIEVPAGTSDIEFRFTSPTLTIGIIITTVTLLASVLFLFVPWRKFFLREPKVST